MLSIITKVLNLLPKNLIQRVGNKYTTHASLLFGYGAVQLGILPQEALDLVDGVPNFDVWLIGTVAFVLLFDKGLPSVKKMVSILHHTEAEKLELDKIQTQRLEEKQKQYAILKDLGSLDTKKLEQTNNEVFNEWKIAKKSKKKKKKNQEVQGV